MDLRNCIAVYNTHWWVINYGHQKYTYLVNICTLSQTYLTFCWIFLMIFFYISHCEISSEISKSLKKPGKCQKFFGLLCTVLCLFLTLTVFCDKAIKLFRIVWSYCCRFLFYWHVMFENDKKKNYHWLQFLNSMNCKIYPCSVLIFLMCTTTKIEEKLTTCVS